MNISKDQIIAQIPYTLKKTNFPMGKSLHKGKVRDTYEINGKRVIITTDRQSAFDRILGTIPFKGQVLNCIAAWWFKKTKDIIPNHVIEVIDPNVLIAKKASVFPVEIIVRAYITGTTSTSAWVNYEKGIRNFCGNIFPEGLKKNQKLECPIITPTTKPETGHDENISPEEIIKQGYMTPDEWTYISQKAMEIFQRGSEICDQNGLILVDTKYEFGKTEKGEIIIIDEMHTPDSSRFWDKKSYEELFNSGKSPKSFDKDVLRRWYSENTNPYEDNILPEAPDELIADLSSVYMEAYEKITGEKFIPDFSKNPEKRIQNSLENL